jgi:hypothetical protein
MMQGSRAEGGEAMNRQYFVIFGALAAMCRLSWGGSLPACTGANFVTQETQQSNCVLTNPGGSVILPASFTNDPTYVNTPLTQPVNNYQTTLTAILNGGTTVYQQTFLVPFSDPSVLAAIAAADGIFTSDGATFGSPFLTSNSTALQSSVLSYVATSPTFTTAALRSCGAAGTSICSGVTVTGTASITATVFGPTVLMTGLDQSDELDVIAGQTAINTNVDFTYTVGQNAVTTNTYLTTQSYEIDGTTGASPTPEPGTFALIGCGLGLVALRRRM